MGFGSYYRNSGIPRLHSYEQALTHYNKTLPIRGRADTSTKPLGNRKSVDAYNFSINPTDQSIICNHYRSRLVTYHVDNIITIHHTTNCQSGGNFVGDLLGITATQRDHEFTITLQGKTYNVPQEGIKLSITPTNNQYYPFFTHDVINPPTAYVHHINRKELKRVNGLYAEVRGYVAGVCKLGATVTRQDIEEVFGKEEHSIVDDKGNVYKWFSAAIPQVRLHNPEEVETLFRWFESDDTTDWHKGAMFVIKSAAGWRDTVSVGQVLVELSTYIYARHKDTLFRTVAVPEGTVRRDIYGKYFRG